VNYEDLVPISREEYSSRFRKGAAEEAGEALLRLAFHDPDPAWAERECFVALRDPRVQVRLAAATGLGHIARRQRRLSPRTIARLSALKADPELRGRVEDAFDDLALFGGADNRGEKS